MAQMVKNLPVMQETWVQTLGWEDSLEKGMATHSTVLAWRKSWTEEHAWDYSQALYEAQRHAADGRCDSCLAPITT